MTALQKEVNALQKDITAFIGKGDDDDPSGSSSD